MALTKQAIWQVADELDTEGTRPTLQAVRKRLGRGSFTTIQDAMQEWKSNQATSDAPAAEVLPEAVAEEIGRAGTAIWQAAMSAAHRRLEEERQQLATERKALEARATEATELADSLSRENDALRQEREALKHQATEAATRQAGEIEQARQEAQEARERAAHLEGRVATLKELLDTQAGPESKPEKSPATDGKATAEKTNGAKKATATTKPDPYPEKPEPAKATRRTQPKTNSTGKQAAA